MRPFHILMLLAGVALLTACAGKKPRSAAKAAAKEDVVAVHGKDPYPYRFDMTQKGKRMSADDFDAWMKARGLRVAKGGSTPKPAKGKGKAIAAAKAKTKPKND
ncbi:hypothetical protein GCM10027400_25180 [Pseudoxanthomonas daejeonensis]